MIRFWSISVGNFCFGKFSLKILGVSLQGQTLFWPYLRNGWSDWCETKRKCIGWILGTICDIYLWPHSWPWPGCFKVNFRNSSFSGIVGLIDVKWKRSELIWYWVDCMTLPFVPHPWPWPWSWNFKVRVWNSFISGMGRPIDMEWKGCESSIHDHDID